MRSVSRRSSFVIGVVAGLALAYIGLPLWKIGVMQVAQVEFGTLTFDCDNAMRSHLLAKQKLVGTPSKENSDSLKSAEIGLLDCQDYDLMRKRLIRWGLTDNELSEMSLLAIEAKGQDLRDVIKTHEIRY
ncbi:MAG: TIGR03982 family His-Xaa-Ser system protein [Flavimaricola sp.]|nr:TIGR03982 family His-Xaa-Ser system protein [Flavimaricola sp.]